MNIYDAFLIRTYGKFSRVTRVGYQIFMSITLLTCAKYTSQVENHTVLSELEKGEILYF